MPKLEANETKDTDKGLASNVAAFFEDAYANHKIEGASMATVGMLAMTRGRAGAGMIGEGLAAQGTHLRVALAMADAAESKLVMQGFKGITDVAAVSTRSVQQDMLMHGAAMANKPGLVTKIEMGLPRNLDAATSQKLADSLQSGNKGAVSTIMDDIFNSNSYESMRRMFGG